GPATESHFKVTLVSDRFEGQRAVRRHQQVYGLLGEELDGGVHALALHLYTPEEWREQGKPPDSPDCRGGGR
ncbi:MAG: BolA family protein, partial [Pseudomonadota bacterium]